MIQKFIIPGRLPGYNELKGNWRGSWHRKKQAMESICWIIKANNIKPINCKAIIEIRCYEPNARRDDDNTTSGAAKIILDSIVKYGILPDDSLKYVTCVKHPVEVDRIEPRIEVSIEAYHGQGKQS